MGTKTSGVEEVEAFVRRYYEHMAALDYEAMRAMSTPELEIVSMSSPDFEILGEGLRIGHAEFEAQIAAAKAQSRELDFEVSQYDTELTEDVAYTSYMLYRPLDMEVGLGEMILRRTDDGWLLDRLVHMGPFEPGY